MPIASDSATFDAGPKILGGDGDLKESTCWGRKNVRAFAATIEVRNPARVIAAYRASRQAVRWPVPIDAHPSMSAHRREFVRALAEKSVPEILRSYVYFSVAEMERMLRLASRYVLLEPLRGIGLELGAGSGLLSSLVARSREVDAIFAVEICEEAADLLLPKVARWVLGDEAHKVVPIIGSFDNLLLPDNSLDFAIEIDAYHHSDDLRVTFTECARVLKPGGWLLCFDRCWPDDHPDWDIERLLSLQYTPEFLAANGYPPDLKLTRRENGEHEYKLREWRAGFEAAGFELCRLCKFWRAVPTREAIKAALSILPLSLRRRLYEPGEERFVTFRWWLTQRWRTLWRNVAGPKDLAAPARWPQMNIFAPRETSVLLLRKKR
ncbi:MAG: class I SAM-dependent methyltransferase [Pyrinomonas methylaliphatogenes]|nr:class I SAM-dependent methyltransferase [Pyrinomonas methylaliphatogenes]